MSQSSFFPGNNLLLEKTTIHATLDDAKEIQTQVGSDLTTMKTFSFDTWRPIVASRYASDPLVMELLNRFERLNNGYQRQIQKITDDYTPAEDPNEPQTWQSIFQ